MTAPLVVTRLAIACPTAPRPPLLVVTCLTQRDGNSSGSRRLYSDNLSHRYSGGRSQCVFDTTLTSWHFSQQKKKCTKIPFNEGACWSAYDMNCTTDHRMTSVHDNCTIFFDIKITSVAEVSSTVLARDMNYFCYIGVCLGQRCHSIGRPPPTHADHIW